MSFEEHVSNSFYLSENTSFNIFCERFQKADSQEIFTVVCERKEDIKVIRDHIYHILKSHNYDEDVLFGISIYSLDSLVSEISKLLASQEDFLKIGDLSFFKKPYLTISEQEELVDAVLSFDHLLVFWGHSQLLIVILPEVVLKNLCFIFLLEGDASVLEFLMLIVVSFKEAFKEIQELTTLNVLHLLNR